MKFSSSRRTAIRRRKVEREDEFFILKEKGD